VNGRQRPDNLLQIVGDVVDLRDALSSEQAVVIGNDWGTSMTWPAARPQLVYQLWVGFG
jgi:pimeloyl-ACP methyl ester carboxylesterase